MSKVTTPYVICIIILQVVVSQLTVFGLTVDKVAYTQTDDDVTKTCNRYISKFTTFGVIINR